MLNQIAESSLKKWTTQAVDCLRRHCKCSDCPMTLFLDGRCKMKNTVIKLVEKYGMPDEYREPTIRE